MIQFQLRCRVAAVSSMAVDKMNEVKETTVQPYLYFSGFCEEALAFYEQALSAKVVMKMRFNQSPDPVPDGRLQSGFENKKKYVGTWVDSMMNHMWRYEGHVDDTGKKLILVAEGPNFMAEGKLTRFRDSYEFKTPDTIIATSEMMSDDGKWFTFMTGKITRKPVAKSAQ